MSEPIAELDDDEYPTEATLEAIKAWDGRDLDGLMEFVRWIWWGGEGYAPTKDGAAWRVSTAGWSGNEDMIESMAANRVWWSFNFAAMKRGGHYVFGNRKVRVEIAVLEEK